MNLHPLNPLPRQFDSAMAKVRMVAQGSLIATMISGPAGIGKTHETKLLLERIGVRFVRMAGSRQALLGALYDYADGDTVILMDDADNFVIGPDTVDLNLMKMAAESNAGGREIVYENERTLKGDAPYPSRWITKAPIICLTNINPDAAGFRGNRAEHFNAIRSRMPPTLLSHEPHWTLDWILHKIIVHDILFEYFHRKPLRYQQDVVDFICDNAYNMRLSVREVRQIAQMRATTDDVREWLVAVESYKLAPSACPANPPPYPARARLIPKSERRRPGFEWPESVVIPPPDTTPAPAPRPVQSKRPAGVLGFGNGPVPLGFMTSRR